MATILVTDPAGGPGVALWVDERHGWLQVYTADGVPGTARRSLAVEPMTAQADAFRSGDDLVVLAAAGEVDDEFSATWGIRGVDCSAAVCCVGDRAQLADRAAGPVAVRALDAHRGDRGAVGEVEGRPRARRAAGARRPPRPTRTRGAGSR